MIIKGHRPWWSSTMIIAPRRSVLARFFFFFFFFFFFLKDQRIGDLFVNGQKHRYATNKLPAEDIDLLSPGENFSISSHFTNFSWSIARWYKNFPLKKEQNSSKWKISYFFNKCGGFYPKNFPSLKSPGQSDTLFFPRNSSKAPKKIFSTVTLSSTNSGLFPPYKYLTHGWGTCKVKKAF